MSRSAMAEQIPATSAVPLSKAEFDAAVVEARRRMRHEDPVGQTWYSLDRDKLARLLRMPEFVALDNGTKEPFIDQAGAWELMPFSKPSEAQAMWARWYPNRAIDDPVKPDDRSAASPDVFYADHKWAEEAGAMMALFQCLPAAAWRVQHEEPMLWVMEHNDGWDRPNAHNFGMCVRKQRDGGGSPAAKSPDTRRGKTSAAVLEKKLSEHLLNQRCSGKGPDSCLPLLHALQSLNPQHEKLVPILKALEPDFALAEEIQIPETFKNRRGDLTDIEFSAIKALRRVAVRKAIFITAKIPVLLEKPSAWPAGELEKTLHTLLSLTFTMQRTAIIQAVRGDGLALGNWFFADPWGRLPKGDAAPPQLTVVLKKLGRELAKSPGCDTANLGVRDLPQQFWMGYALEKLEKEQTSCGVFSSYTQVAKVYSDAAKQNKPTLLESINEVRKFLDKQGPTHDDVMSALSLQCPQPGEPAQADPWRVCLWAAKKLADAERKQKSSEPQELTDPSKCAEGVELTVVSTLGYAEDRPHHLACKLMPSDARKSIVALAFIRDDAASPDNGDMGEYDLDVLIVQTATGKILSHLHLDKMYASDAWRFSGIAIDTGRYSLAPNIRAFGVRAMQEGSSRANPASETSLNLYIYKNRKVRQVLRGLVIRNFRGEWDTQCAGSFSETQRVIKVGKPARKGFADLIVTSTTNNSENRMIKEDCAAINHKPEVAHFTLRYDGKTYVVPPVLLQLQ